MYLLMHMQGNEPKYYLAHVSKRCKSDYDDAAGLELQNERNYDTCGVFYAALSTCK
jgi:hypothetical protein